MPYRCYTPGMNGEKRINKSKIRNEIQSPPRVLTDFTKDLSSLARGDINLGEEETRMKNNKGMVPVVVLCFMIGFGVIGLTAIAHIPAWSAAKAAHCESAYQAGDYACGYVKK